MQGGTLEKVCGNDCGWPPRGKPRFGHLTNGIPSQPPEETGERGLNYAQKPKKIRHTEIFGWLYALTD